MISRLLTILNITIFLWKEGEKKVKRREAFEYPGQGSGKFLRASFVIDDHMPRYLRLAALDKAGGVLARSQVMSRYLRTRLRRE